MGKVNVYHWIDNKTHDEFTGSIEEYCKKYDVLKPTALRRVKTKRVTREFVGVRGLKTFTDIRTGDRCYGLKKDAMEHFGCSRATLYSLIDEGLIQVFPPDDEPTNSEEKISEPKTKRLLNQYYLRKANELGL